MSGSSNKDPRNPPPADDWNAVESGFFETGDLLHKAPPIGDYTARLMGHPPNWRDRLQGMHWSSLIHKPKFLAAWGGALGAVLIGALVWASSGPEKAASPAVAAAAAAPAPTAAPAAPARSVLASAAAPAAKKQPVRVRSSRSAKKKVTAKAPAKAIATSTRRR
jgi:hypothetical protein